MKSILRTLNAMMIITEQTMEEMFVKCTAVARAQKVADGFGEIDLNESVFQRINAQFHWIILRKGRRRSMDGHMIREDAKRYSLS